MNFDEHEKFQEDNIEMEGDLIQLDCCDIERIFNEIEGDEHIISTMHLPHSHIDKKLLLFQSQNHLYQSNCLNSSLNINYDPVKILLEMIQINSTDNDKHHIQSFNDEVSFKIPSSLSVIPSSSYSGNYIMSRVDLQAQNLCTSNVPSSECDAEVILGFDKFGTTIVNAYKNQLDSLQTIKNLLSSTQDIFRNIHFTLMSKPKYLLQINSMRYQIFHHVIEKSIIVSNQQIKTSFKTGEIFNYQPKYLNGRYKPWAFFCPLCKDIDESKQFTNENPDTFDEISFCKKYLGVKTLRYTKEYASILENIYEICQQDRIPLIILSRQFIDSQIDMISFFIEEITHSRMQSTYEIKKHLIHKNLHNFMNDHLYPKSILLPEFISLLYIVFRHTDVKQCRNNINFIMVHATLFTLNSFFKIANREKIIDYLYDNTDDCANQFLLHLLSFILRVCCIEPLLIGLKIRKSVSLNYHCLVLRLFNHEICNEIDIDEYTLDIKRISFLLAVNEIITPTTHPNIFNNITLDSYEVNLVKLTRNMIDFHSFLSFFRNMRIEQGNTSSFKRKYLKIFDKIFHTFLSNGIS